MTKLKSRRILLPFSFVAGATLVCGSLAFAQVVEESHKAPPALNTVQVPQVNNLDNFVKSYSDAILLGKALFWDQQAGSDGQACASCHFHAGVDNRVKNQLSPGLLRENNPDTTFQQTASGGYGGPNYTLVPEDFPFHQFNDPNDRHSGVKFTTNDAASSQGTFSGTFQAVPDQYELDDDCARTADPVFHVNDIGVRRVEPRHTPGIINSVFNFRNFWDGRANNVFNGVDPFGLRNTQAFRFNEYGVKKKVDLRNSALASQSVGPPESDFEMICTGRKFSQMGRKMIPRRALQFQQVHFNDSVLGSNVHGSGTGLMDTYETLIKRAFKDHNWKGSGPFPDGFTHMESNFSLFWGIAIQMYQSTLISDQAPYDAFAAGHSEEFEPEDGNIDALTSGQFRGLKIFLDKGKCINCHKGPEFSGAASVLQAENQEKGLVERMFMGDGGVALYDNGFYNIGVTPTNEDISVGGNDPFGNPLSFTKQFVNRNFIDPIQVDPCTFEVPFYSYNCSHVPSYLNNERLAVRGAFKTAILRNVELTGPFMHNGSMKSLTEVVEFYNRGGNFHNNPELDPDIQNLGLSKHERADLVAFLLALTDQRVTNESAPFDHPQIQVPNGHPGNENNIDAVGELSPNLANDNLLVISAVGAGGRSAEGLSPLQPFFNIVEDKNPPVPVNVALGRAATQSSYYTNAYYPIAEDAVDGNVDGNWTAGSVSSTLNETQAWWEVDLGQIADISKIRVWNRTDCCSNRLANFHVLISDTPFVSTELATTQNQAGVIDLVYPGTAGRTTDFTVDQTGRYVRIQLAGTNTLALAEVEVLGVLTEPVTPAPSNVALGRAATQSSYYTNAYTPFAEDAVDGNVDGNWTAGSVSSTLPETQAWWQVDLGQIVDISKIRVWNRTDCCSNRLANFHVLISDTPFVSTGLAATQNQAGVIDLSHPGTAGGMAAFTVNQTGRYVRIQLAGTNHLTLAEVEVIGTH